MDIQSLTRAEILERIARIEEYGGNTFRIEEYREELKRRNK